MLSRSHALAAWLIASGCADDQTKPAARDAQPSQLTETTADPVSFTCSPTQLANGLSLTLIPASPPQGPGVAIFRQVDAECSWHEPAQVVLHNGSASDVEISELGLDDPHFTVQPIELPYTLAAGDILPLPLDFKTELGSFNALLSVASSDGCVQFPVRAKGVEASKVGVIVHAPYVVHFGHVAAGTESDPVDITVLDQPIVGSPKGKIAGFQTSSPNFRIEPQATSAADDACAPLKVSVRLVAPDKAGLIRGQLSWTFEDQQAAASTLTELVGVVDP